MTEIVVHELVTVTADEAGRLETEFLNGLDQAQDAFERIMDANAWAALGYDSFADWWEQRVVPTMRALSMRPSREIAGRVLDQIREEEAGLPSAQRRRGAELAELAGVSEWVVESRQDPRPPRSTVNPDLASAEDQPDGDPAEEPVPGLDAGTEDIPPSEAGGVAASSAGASSPPGASGRGDGAPEPATPVPGSGASNGNGRTVGDEHAADDARRDSELDDALSGTDQRFRTNFAAARRAAREITTYDVDRVVEVFGHANWEREVGDLLRALTGWCQQVENAHRTQQRAGLRLVAGGKS